MAGICLHLGCGDSYYPGYINIDKFNATVADVIGDGEYLPFAWGSIDIVVAYQFLEHFDWYHCRYVLAELFMVLQDNGTLVIETPDLQKTLRKWKQLKLPAQLPSLNWVYGIDSPGMSHKSGFSESLLQHLLSDSGFSAIQKQKALTHNYAPGLRLVCRKKNSAADYELLAAVRIAIKNHLGWRDSPSLLLLEPWIQRLFSAYRQQYRSGDPGLTRALLTAAIVNPQLPLVFLEQGIARRLFCQAEQQKTIEFLQFLTTIKFPQKLFSLWLRRKKHPGRADTTSLHLLIIWPPCSTRSTARAMGKTAWLISPAYPAMIPCFLTGYRWRWQRKRLTPAASKILVAIGWFWPEKCCSFRCE